MVLQERSKREAATADAIRRDANTIATAAGLIRCYNVDCDNDARANANERV